MVKLLVKNLGYLFVLAVIITAWFVFYNYEKTDAQLSSDEPVMVEQLVIDEQRAKEKKTQASIIEKILANKKSNVLSGEEDEQLEPQILGEMAEPEPKNINTSITIETDELMGEENVNSKSEKEPVTTKGVSTSFSIIEE